MSGEKLITSPDNALFKDLRSCLESKGMKKHGLFILSGKKLVMEFLKTRPLEVVHIVAPPDVELPDFDRKPGKSSVPTVIRFERSLFNELDVFGTKSPLLVGKRPKLAKWQPEKPPQGIEVLCALGEPSNLGALLRTCAAFEVSRVILLKESAFPYHPKALRAAAGTTWLTPLVEGPSISDLAQDKNVSATIVALNMKGADVNKFNWPKNVRLLIGQEGPGVPKTEAFTRVSIRMSTKVESLNATVAASLALFSYRQQN